MTNQSFIDVSGQEISEKSKKNEIFEAYQTLLGKIKEGKQESHQEEKKKKQEGELVAKASDLTPDRIVSNIANVKISIGQSLDALEQRLYDEYRKLHDLQQAISIETENLEELHEIKKDVDSLNAILLAQKEYKEKFEQEMQAKKKTFEVELAEVRMGWAKEQEVVEQEKRERELKAKRDRVREEEEYRYSVQLERKKEQDLYEENRNSLEKELVAKKEIFYKELSEREAIIKTHEEEYKMLKVRVDQFPLELEKAIKETEKTTRESIERNYKYQIDLTSKEVDGERKLTQQMITSLQTKIKEQETFIRQLTQKADDAGTQVQSIALKAIEGASNLRFYGSTEDGKKSGQATN